MVIKEKRTVSPIYIENFDKHEFICEYHPITGRYTERLRDEFSNNELATGYYVKVNDSVFGVFATSKGPVLFRNDSQFLLEQGKYHVNVIERLGKRIFCLAIDGKGIFETEYEKPKYVNYDAWSDEKVVDFFLWLSQKDQNKFHDYYTIKNSN
ncbi:MULTISPECIES: hypothetical protein [Sporomusa]|uniref:hypothetical protein n=1 Tax=Sporomusa TaxID=2375 RepID=UPI0031593198